MFLLIQLGALQNGIIPFDKGFWNSLQICSSIETFFAVGKVVKREHVMIVALSGLTMSFSKCAHLKIAHALTGV